MNKIIVKLKDRVVSEVPFKGDAMTIGRDSGNDVKIDTPAVSSIHARIIREGGAFVLEDADSTNGTFLNGKKTKRSIINSTDEIMIGKHQVILGWKSGTGEFDKDGKDEPITPVDISLDKTMMFAPSAKKSGAGSGKKPVAFFAVMEGNVEKDRVKVTDAISTIGKSPDALIKLKGLFAPKVAALVKKRAKGYEISSANAKKPAIVNAKPVDKDYLLKNGDIVEVGGITLRFYMK